VFELVYRRATHVKEFWKDVNETGRSPLDDGVELFGKALDVWCRVLGTVEVQVILRNCEGGS